MGACKNFGQTERFVHFLEKRLKDYLIETGEIFPPGDAARILSEILDEETLGRTEDSTDKELQLTNYEPMKEYILQRDAKLKSRQSTRHKPSAKGPDDMVYGVESKPRAAEPPPARAPAPQIEDPWRPLLIPGPRRPG